jgi:DNA-binding HxlR family transcriptional regulator
VDVRTADLLDALRHPGAAFLLELLAEDATEADLLGVVKRSTQATGNRRLAALEKAGVIERSAGRVKAPGRRWAVVHPQETDELLRAALALASAAADHEAATREDANRALKRQRAERQGLREVGDGSV